MTQDKSEDFTTVSEAVKATPRNSNPQFIKPGIYKEHIEIEFEMTFITLIGDGVSKTIITFTVAMVLDLQPSTLAHSVRIMSSSCLF